MDFLVAEQHVDGVVAGITVDHVAAVIAARFGASCNAAPDDVVAAAAMDGVIPVAADQDVVAAIARDGVAAGTTGDILDAVPADLVHSGEPACGKSIRSGPRITFVVGGAAARHVD